MHARDGHWGPLYCTKRKNGNLEDTILAPVCDNPSCLNLEIKLTSASKEMGRGVTFKGIIGMI